MKKKLIKKKIKEVVIPDIFKSEEYLQLKEALRKLDLFNLRILLIHVVSNEVNNGLRRFHKTMENKKS